MTISPIRFAILIAIVAALLGGEIGALRAETQARSGDVTEGKRTFSVHCSHCHGPFGHGLFGPSLVDLETLNGNTFEDILRVIADGVPGTAMRSWSNFNDERLNAVATFVFSLYGTMVEDTPATE